MKILIIGGNRFFGKRLAHTLVQEGERVTLLNRGREDDELAGKVRRIICDRNDKQAMIQALGKESWDIVYDQVCYDLTRAKQACEIFSGKVGKVIFTSSQSVYPLGVDLKEEDFDPNNYKFDKEVSGQQDYAEAKRQAEAGYFQYAPFPVTAVRLPIVFGPDDYTGRFDFHLRRIAKGETIYFPNIKSKLSLIDSHTAAQVLAELRRIDASGPINVALDGKLGLDELVELIEYKFKKNAKLATEGDEQNTSPYGLPDDWTMDCTRLKSLGIETPALLSRIVQVLDE